MLILPSGGMIGSKMSNGYEMPKTPIKHILNYYYNLRKFSDIKRNDVN